MTETEAHPAEDPMDWPAREKREALVAKKGWTIIGWEANPKVKDRRRVIVNCTRDKMSFRDLPYHGSLALWTSMLHHKDCKHGRKAPPPPKKCKACGQNLPEVRQHES